MRGLTLVQEVWVQPRGSEQMVRMSLVSGWGPDSQEQRALLHT